MRSPVGFCQSFTGDLELSAANGMPTFDGDAPKVPLILSLSKGGHTDNLEHRIAQHNDGTLVGYTSQRRPAELLYSQSFDKLRMSGYKLRMSGYKLRMSG